MMDLTFKTDEGIFNYRVCAIILKDSKILAMKNDISPYYFLPGGRVELHESADDAIAREIREELCVDAQIVRPLWLNQNFFIEDTIGEKFHELCIYYLIDVSNTDLVNSSDMFTTRKSKHNEIFYWLSIDSLKDDIFILFLLKIKLMLCLNI